MILLVKTGRVGGAERHGLKGGSVEEAKNLRKKIKREATLQNNT